MKRRDEIWQELNAIAPELAKRHKHHPYQVPPQYFLSLSARLLEYVKTNEVREELTTLAPELSNLEKQKEAALPAGYFQGFSAKMIEQIRMNTSADELKQVAPLLSQLPRVNVYRAPEGYFHRFTAQIQTQVQAENASTPAAFPAWLSRINALLDQVINAVFKPRYAFAFTGSAAVMIMMMIMVIKIDPVPPCPKDDLFCQLEKVSDADLDAYFNSHPDEFQKSVLEVSTDDTKLSNRSRTGDLSLDQYLLNNITDEELNNAILN